jgi:hypothetical protein
MKTFQKIAAALLLLIGSSQLARSADTYTPNCRIVQMPTGSNDTLWGTKANAAFAMLDQCISQGTVISVTGGNVTLTTANNAADQARSAIIAFTGTPGTTRTITMPNVSKLTWVANSSNASLIFTAGAGTTATVIAGATALIYTDSSTNAVALMNVASSAQAILAAGLGTAASQPASAFMAGANNGSEFTNMATVRTNLGLGNAAVKGVANNAHSTVPTLDGSAISNNDIVIYNADGSLHDGGLPRADVATLSGNLAGLGNTATARANLGLGSTATLNALGTQTSVATIGGTTPIDHFPRFDSTGSLIDSTFTGNSFAKVGNNLSDLASAGTSRANLGLGSIATHNVTISTSAPSGGSDGDIWFRY